MRPVPSPPPDPTAFVAEPRAPWFFLWIQELLRVAPPFLVGVLTPVIILLGLALLPYPLDRSEQGVAQWFNRPGRTAQFVFLGVLSDILAFVLRATVR